MSSWFAYTKPTAAPRLRMVCLPYAGGAASVFRGWQALVPPGVEVWPVQYPGRETRWKEPALLHMETLVASLVEALRPLQERPYLLFGHSLGALVAFELARGLRAAGLRPPEHLFVSACPPPHEEAARSQLEGLDDAGLLEALRALNGIPEEAFSAPGLLEMMLPVIRADLRLAGGYRPREEAPLDCPLTALGGLQDASVSRTTLSGWAQHTTRDGGVRMLPGDHFYLRQVPYALLSVLLGPVAPLLAAG